MALSSIAFTAYLVSTAAAAAIATSNSSTILAVSPATSSSSSDESSAPASFRPSIAVIVGVLTTMFSLTFLLLIYAKHCKRAGGSEAMWRQQQQQELGSLGLFPPAAAASSTMAPTARQDTGVDPLLVQALPTFAFSSLKGPKEGLECAVCLSRYSGDELLRFLPKCKHAFHVACLDTWLAARSTCPLCRHTVSSEDALIVDEMVMLMLSSRRHSLDLTHQSTAAAAAAQVAAARSSLDLDFQIYVHTDEAEGSTPEQRRIGHRIILSDVVLQRRWSDLVPSDVLFLGGSTTLFWPSEASQAAAAKPTSMLKRAFSAGHGGRYQGSAASSSLKAVGRCRSEITSMERFGKSKLLDVVDADEHRRWGSVARRTMNWLMGSRRERKQQQQLGVVSGTKFPAALANV